MNNVFTLKDGKDIPHKHTDFRRHNTITTLVDHSRRIVRENIPDKNEFPIIHQVGVFWTISKIPKRQITRLHELMPFFHLNRVKNVLIPIISMRSMVSLRALDWFIINYAKKHKIALINKYSHFLSVYDDYRTWLKYWRRSTFDAFRRGTRLFFHVDGISYSTTIAQLNFLYWSEKTGVLDYVAKYITVIEKDMNARIAECKKTKEENIAKGNKRKRSELSTTIQSHCMVYKLPVTLQF
jgi:hypothetical protein